LLKDDDTKNIYSYAGKVKEILRWHIKERKLFDVVSTFPFDSFKALCQLCASQIASEIRIMIQELNGIVHGDKSEIGPELQNTGKVL